MDGQHGISSPTVALSVGEYNKLYEQAYLNEKRRQLEEERQQLQKERLRQEEELREKSVRAADASKRREREQRGAVAARNWLLVKHAAEGTYERSSTSSDGGMVVFDFTMELRVFEDEWTCIPLIDAQLIADNWRLERATQQGDGSWEDVALNSSNTLLVVQEIDEAPPRQVLATNKSGLYRLRFSIFTHVACTRNLNSLGLHLLFPITALKLHIKHGHGNAAASGGRKTVRELSVTPAAHCVIEEKDGSADVSVQLPATKVVEVKWRSLDPSEAQAEKESKEAEPALPGTARASDGEKKAAAEQLQAPQVTVVQETLHSIEDGVLQSSHTLKYTLDAEQAAMTSARIQVPEKTRVTSVTGYGVLSWRHSGGSAGGEGSAAKGNYTVEVVFKSSLITDKVILLITTETEITSNDLELPVLTCQDVLRQTGSCGVVKMANVEVHESEVKGVASVSVDELSEELKYQTTLPIMFAYKNLSQNYSVKLTITKHEQVNVLEAIVDTAYYQSLVVDTQCMHRLMMVLQNTRQQYLEVRGLPSDMRVWSLMVNSVPAKPVQGKDGTLLIPLLVGTDSDSNKGAQKTSVEVAYLSQHGSLGKTGNFDIALPQLNVPTSTLLVEVQFPDIYDVEFSGSLEKVSRFSYPLPVPVNNAKGTTVVPMGFNFNNMVTEVQQSGVNVQMPRGGVRHHFQRLLVVDAGASLSAKYEVPTKEDEESSSLWKRLLPCKRRRVAVA